MNYRIVLEYSVNNDEVEQPHPTKDEVISLIYNASRFIPWDVRADIKSLEVDVF